MRNVYTIQDNETGTWCRSSKEVSFTPTFEHAAIYFTKNSAREAVLRMLERLSPDVDYKPDWTIVEYTLNRVVK